VLTVALVFATLGTILAAFLTGAPPRRAALHPRAVVGRALRP
jgi:hypothetical protein